MGDVSKKLIDQFADNLNTMLDEQGTEATSPEAAPADEAATASEGEESPKVRKIEGPAAEPVDLATFGPTVLKQALPVIALVVLLLVILRRRS